MTAEGRETEIGVVEQWDLQIERSWTQSGGQLLELVKREPKLVTVLWAWFSPIS